VQHTDKATGMLEVRHHGGFINLEANLRRIHLAMIQTIYDELQKRRVTQSLTG